MENMPFVNVHAHAAGGEICLLDVGTSLSDAPRRAPGLWYSVGFHPVRLAGGAPLDWAAFRAALSAEGVVAVGECGLDRRLPVPLDGQMSVFLRQAEEAESRSLPLVVHCVRAYPELVAARRSGAFRMPWVVHGFNNNGQTLGMLLRHGFHVSLGGALLNPGSNAARLLPGIPPARLFLETDDRPLGIRSVYEAAAARLGLSLEELKRQIYANFNNVFLWNG